MVAAGRPGQGVRAGAADRAGQLARDVLAVGLVGHVVDRDVQVRRLVAVADHHEVARLDRDVGVAAVAADQRRRRAQAARAAQRVVAGLPADEVLQEGVARLDGVVLVAEVESGGGRALFVAQREVVPEALRVPAARARRRVIPGASVTSSSGPVSWIETWLASAGAPVNWSRSNPWQPTLDALARP